MSIRKTDKDILEAKDILAFISNYEASECVLYDRLYEYYSARNVTIKSRDKKDVNAPDNKIAVSYGRKLVKTFAGYAYRPKYTTYKATVERNLALETDRVETPSELYMNELQKTFNLNSEHIKTSNAGRNMAIYGLSYELMYIDSMVEGTKTIAQPRFYTVDPRELILLYDFSPEPKKKIAIHFYKTNINEYRVEVYYKEKVVVYKRTRNEATSEWELELLEEYLNLFGDVPVVPYYFGDEMMGVIEPVLDLIDAYDVLVSDSMNEFDRFAYAYMIMKRFGITDPSKLKGPEGAQIASAAVRDLKKKKIFEHLPSDADIKFLTKDIPTGFIEFMSNLLREQIHVQSHVPDFTSEKMTNGVSGVAIQRLLFDFENLVSTSEATFDAGLLERIRLITIIFAKTMKPIGTFNDITISHKRNMPLNLKDYAETAKIMKEAGFSAYLCADIMPDDIIPDVQAELARQQTEHEKMVEFEPEGYPALNQDTEPEVSKAEIENEITEEETDER